MNAAQRPKVIIRDIYDNGSFLLTTPENGHVWSWRVQTPKRWVRYQITEDWVVGLCTCSFIHFGWVAALGSLFSDRFPMCSSSIVFSVRVIVWLFSLLFCQPYEIFRELLGDPHVRVPIFSTGKSAGPIAHWRLNGDDPDVKWVASGISEFQN